MQTNQSVIVFGQLDSCAIIIIIVMMEDKRKHFTNEQSRTQSHIKLNPCRGQAYGALVEVWINSPGRLITVLVTAVR